MILPLSVFGEPQKKEKNVPSITAKGRYQHVPPLFISASQQLNSESHQSMTAAVTGQTRSFLLFFRKNDSKMCFTTMRYLFAPTRDSLQTASLATLLSMSVSLSCVLLYSLLKKMSNIFLKFSNFVACTGFEGRFRERRRCLTEVRFS